MIKRILLGLGGTPYTTAEVRHAIELAIQHQAELTAVTVCDLARISDVGPVPIGASAASASLINFRLEAAQNAIEEAIRVFEAECQRAGIHPRVIREAGNPFDELVSLWRYHDLTVLALQSLFEYGVVRDPKDMLLQLLHKGVRPIFAVAREYRPVRRVLIAYNGSMESAKAMKQFVQWPLFDDVEVRVVCFESSHEKAAPLIRDAQQYLQAHGVHADVDHQPGDAHDALLPYAEQWNADMIVLGATSRARIFRHVIGDVALRAITRSTIPLYITQ
jgi:nucleotide-binding universal stress UspA family protein